jgi:2,4-dienoyl-CoA reductase-like NADH-dependent reductase (Old Yellow Enzyme family)
MVGRFDLEEGYNLPATRRIRSAVADLPVMLVGGLRRLDQMESTVQEGWAGEV